MGSWDRWIVGRRGAALCALIALVSGLSGLWSLPALDRNESAFVQATVQMLESGDFTAIRYQDYWRGGASPGVHWLQAIAVNILSSPEAREIWPYRLVSLLGLSIAAAATCWGGAALFGRRAGFIAGSGLAVSLAAATAGGVATADAAFLAACAVMVAGFGRVYLAAREGRAPRRRDRVFFWAGLIAGTLIKGPFALILAAFMGGALLAADRRARWFPTLGWAWGLLALFAFAGPWVVAVTIASDGAYWGPLSRPPLAAGPPLWQTWMSPVFLFPLTALLPAAAVFAWRERRTTGVKVALAWLIPAWLAVELMPGKQVFGPLPLYIALAWLCAAGLDSALAGKLSRRLGAVLVLSTGIVGAVLLIQFCARHGAGLDLLSGIVAGVLFLLAGGAAAYCVLRPAASKALIATAFLAMVAPAWLYGAALPSLDGLWPTRRILGVLAETNLDPREGLAVGPVAAAGYHEPSLVFALGASTEIGDGALAARAVADGRPAIVELGEDARFRQAAADLGVRPQPIGRIEAYDYAAGRQVTVTVYAKG